MTMNTLTRKFIRLAKFEDSATVYSGLRLDVDKMKFYQTSEFVPHRYFYTRKGLMGKETTDKATNLTNDKSKEERKNDVRKRYWEMKRTFGPLLKPAVSGRPTNLARIEEKELTEGVDTIINVREAGYKYLPKFPPRVSEQIVVAKVDEKERRLSSLPLESLTKLSYGVKILTAPKPAWRDLKVKDSNRNRVDRVVGIGGEQSLDLGLSEALKWLSTFPLINTPENRASVAECLAELHSLLTFKHSPYVSNILQKTMPAKSRQALENWKNTMIAKLGSEEFEKYQAALFEVGRSLHQCIKEYLTKKKFDDVQVESDVAGYWRSLRKVLADISDVFLLETTVEHPFLLYRGVLDCVANYRGTAMLIEWKTSQRPKAALTHTFDNPLQAAAYVGALNFSDHLNFQVTRAAVVVAYSSGAPAHVHLLNEELTKEYWNQWLKRLGEFSTLDP